MPTSAQQIKAFAAKIKGMQAEGHALSNETRLKVYRIVESHRVTINDAIRRASVDGGKVLPSAEAPRLSELIKRESVDMSNEIVDTLKDAQKEAMETATYRAQAIADVADIEGVFFAPSAELAALAQGYAADLVSTITPELMPQVNALLGRAGMGTISPYEAMQGIDAVIGIKGNGGVSYQAERIVRTEVNRIYNVTLDTQLQTMSNYFPKSALLRKRWVSGPFRPGRREEHQQMDGVTVGFNEPFILPSGARLMHPGDPSGPADEVINCGCGWVMDETSVLDALTL